MNMQLESDSLPHELAGDNWNPLSSNKPRHLHSATKLHLNRHLIFATMAANTTEGPEGTEGVNELLIVCLRLLLAWSQFKFSS